MHKKLTVIVYQDKIALPDVYRWAAENKFTLIPGKRPPLHYYVERGEEMIHLVPQTYDLMELRKPDKLVLWGAFDADNLVRLLEYMQQ